MLSRADRHYIIYCDESIDRGPYFSNFYAGALLLASRRQHIADALEQVKKSENVFGEIKWTKISEAYEEKYIQFIEKFFEYVNRGDIKVRLMFTQNIYKAANLTEDNIEDKYFILYYQFIKNAFGLRYSNERKATSLNFSIYLDNVPQTQHKFEKFQDFLSNLSYREEYRSNGITIPRSEIVSVNSKEHVILQAVDVVLGAMQFKLNEKHKEKPLGSKLRGKRTRSKERVYKRILQLIQEIHPRFNIGISTGQAAGPQTKWTHHYRHWKFIPSDMELDLSQGKKK